MRLIRWGRIASSGVLWILYVSSALALPSNVVSPTTRSEQEGEQARRLEQLEQAKESLQQLQQLPTLPEAAEGESGVCFDIQSIYFDGNEKFSDFEILMWLDFSPSCLDLTAVNNYLRIITNHYIEAGYVTSRAFLVPQDLSSGTLMIVILEGKVEKVMFNDSEIERLYLAFWGIKGTILNLRDIEQGLDQINRLSRYNATIKLLPGTTPGYSIVAIQTSVGSLGHIGLEVNNGGQKSTGEEQLVLNLSGENVLGLLDKWSLSATRSAAFVDSRNSESVYLSADFPLGYWNVAYRTSYSSYQTVFNSKGFSFDSSGKTNSHDADLQWLFFRDDRSKSSLKLGVHHRREKNYILGTLLASGSRNLSSLSLALEYSSRFAGGFMTLSPGLSIGTDWFGGEETKMDNSNLPTAQFTKGNISASYSYPVSAELSMNTTLFGQWSNDTLYSSERLSIGGEYSVRGFKGASLSGDEGYYWRNDLTYQIGRWSYLGAVTAKLALDTGSIAKDSADQFERGSLLGTSLTLANRHVYYSSSFSLGFPLEAPSHLKADEYVLYYRLNVML